MRIVRFIFNIGEYDEPAFWLILRGEEVRTDDEEKGKENGSKRHVVVLLFGKRNYELVVILAIRFDFDAVILSGNEESPYRLQLCLLNAVLLRFCQEILHLPTACLAQNDEP